MQFNPQYSNRANLITAIGSLDYMAITTNQLFDGEEREYVVIPSLRAWYAQRPNGTYRILRLDGITNH